MIEDIHEAITLWIALGNPKSEFHRELTPELEEFWVQVEKEIKEIKDQGFGVEIPFM